MIKTEFMKLYERLETINEAVEDIDFNALAKAEQEAEDLWKEIRELKQSYRKKADTAIGSDETYLELRKELWKLMDQLSDLKDTYWRREWFETAPGDWEHDDWVDEEAYAKVKDREEALKADIAKMEANLEAVQTKIESQFEADAAELRAKGAEREKKLATIKGFKSQLAQAYTELEPEIKAVINFLNADQSAYGCKINWEVDPNSLAYNKKGRIIVRLFTTIQDSDDDFSPSDFDDDGALSEKDAQYAAESLAENVYAYPEQFAEYLELESSDEGWYRIPDSKWELCNEAEVEVTETPVMTSYKEYPATYWQPAESDWEIEGDLAAEVSIYIGKKLSK